jgi:hypothetical protein
MEGRMEEFMRPTIDLMAQGKFLQKWEGTNPWTTKNVPGMRGAVDEIAR